VALEQCDTGGRWIGVYNQAGQQLQRFALQCRRQQTLRCGFAVLTRITMKNGDPLS
jgi:hypothetical protein